jgi:cytochrome oxidase Cu insertion factor (SCO1/SenC/PrrC family)
MGKVQPLENRPGRRFLGMGTRSVGLSVAAGLLLAVVGALTSVHFTGCNSAQAALAASRPDEIWAPGARPAPDFVLRDVGGRMVSLSQQRGRVLLLTFLDSACKLTCPVEGVELSQALRGFGRSSPLTLIVVSVQPGADTAASVRSVVSGWGGWQTDWHWLVGSGDGALEQVWDEYGISVAEEQGTVQHSSDLFLIDGQGYERAGFAAPFLVRPVAQSIEDLMKEVSGPSGVLRSLAACSG